MQIEVDQLVEPLAAKLARLVAGEVELALLGGMTDLQRELLEQAREHRKSQSEVEQQLASRLEAASERIGRVWDQLGEPEGGRLGISGKNRRPFLAIANGATTDDLKRSRGRPRKLPANESGAAGEHRDSPAFSPEA